MKITIDDIQEAKQRFHTLWDNYLEQQGWIQTCMTPGSTWLWKKKIDGTVYTVEKETAFWFETQNPKNYEHEVQS